MVYRWFLHHWLRQAAEQKVRQTVAEAAREQLAGQAKSTEDRPVNCDVGVVFALTNEAGGFEDLLSDVARIRANGFRVRLGELKRRRVAVAISGAGRAAAAKATEALISGHKPSLVISAGFCGGLSETLERHDLVVADALLDGEGNRLAVDLSRLDAALLSKQEVHAGALLEVERIVRLPREKRQLGEKHQALAADLESMTVAKVCRDRETPFLAIRVVSDTVDEKLPREVENLLRQETKPAQFGAALGAIFNRPGSFKDMYRLHENALLASDRLAKCVAGVIQQLIPLPPETTEKQTPPEP